MKGPPNRVYNTPADLVKSSLDICCLLSREGKNTVCCLQVFVATNPTDVCLQWVHSAYGVELWCTLLPSYQLYFLALTAQNSCENPKVVLWKKTLKHFKTRTSVLLQYLFSCQSSFQIWYNGGFTTPYVTGPKFFQFLSNVSVGLIATCFIRFWTRVFQS